jgi:hypothetical protein
VVIRNERAHNRASKRWEHGLVSKIASSYELSFCSRGVYFNQIIKYHTDALEFQAFNTCISIINFSVLVLLATGTMKQGKGEKETILLYANKQVLQWANRPTAKLDSAIAYILILSILTNKVARLKLIVVSMYMILILFIAEL